MSYKNTFIAQIHIFFKLNNIINPLTYQFITYKSNDISQGVIFCRSPAVLL